MNFQAYEFTQEEKKLRKRWLVLTVITSLWSDALALGILFSGSFLSENPLTTLLLLLFLLFLTIGWVYLYYYCAYKNPGSRLLTFSLVIGAICVLLPNYAGTTLWQIPGSLLSIVWYVFTYELRRLNKKIQRTQTKQNILTQLEKHHLIISKIQNVSSLEELNLLIPSLFEELPDLKQVISDEYEKKKTLLLQPT